MKNTDNKDTRRMFIISFGDSRQYKVTVEDKNRAGALEPIVRTENELNEFLAKTFPGETFSYYTTPRIVEIDKADQAEYASYPELDDKAIAEVKKDLVREIQVMNSDRELNSNDPWGK